MTRRRRERGALMAILTVLNNPDFPTERKLRHVRRVAERGLLVPDEHECHVLCEHTFIRQHPGLSLFIALLAALAGWWRIPR